jgi:glycosyltransferase involved in cell wall biosynthesis
VVPICDVKRYLRQCLDSIVGQTLRDLEIILVDDGSTDGCAEIVDEYATKDKRVVAIHQPNGGVGRAYNVGIARATGEYIGLVESDDWIEPDMYELLYNAAKEHGTDLVKAPFYVHNSAIADAALRDVVNKAYASNQVLFDLAEDAPRGIFTIEDCPLLIAYHCSPWSYLYRGDFIRQISFVESPGASFQDAPFVAEVLCRATGIVVVPKPLVHWRIDLDKRDSSSMGDGSNLLAILDRVQEQKMVLKSMGKYAAIREAFYIGVFSVGFFFLENIREKYKRRLFFGLRRLLLDLDEEGGFQGKYFSDLDRCHITQLRRGSYFAYRLAGKSLWSFLLSVHIGRKGFLFQLLGLQVSSGKYTNRPALLAWRMD